MTIHSQIWNGTFIINSACDTTSCCCLVDSIVFTQPSSDMLSWSTDLSGDLCAGEMLYRSIGPYPTGYTLSSELITGSNTTDLTMTLSNDSNMLTITSSSPSCGATAVRENSFTEATTVYTYTTQIHTTHSHASQQCISKIIVLVCLFLVL